MLVVIPVLHISGLSLFTSLIQRFKFVMHFSLFDLYYTCVSNIAWLSLWYIKLLFLLAVLCVYLCKWSYSFLVLLLLSSKSCWIMSYLCMRLSHVPVLIDSIWIFFLISLTADQFSHVWFLWNSFFNHKWISV